MSISTTNNTGKAGTDGFRVETIGIAGDIMYVTFEGLSDGLRFYRVGVLSEAMPGDRFVLARVPGGDNEGEADAAVPS